MSRRVVIVIVEGDSDEALLIDRLRELYHGCEIRFESQRGDVLYDYRSRESIKKTIGDIVKGIIAKRKYKHKDILAVVHIMDTDGCMIPDDSIEVDTQQDMKTVYTLETIKVDSDNQKHNIVERNKKRTINIKTMNSIDTVVGKKYKYQLYYFSRNLEHVIFDEPNPEQEFKCENIESFVDELTITVEEFLSEHLPDLTAKTYCGQHKESWAYISKGTKSLKRGTNVPLLFDFINEEVNGE